MTVAAFAFAMSVSPVAASSYEWGGHHQSSDTTVGVNVEDTTVTNNTSTNANTGHNSVSGSGNYYHYWYWFGPYTQGGVRGTINTGDATAVSDVLNEVNTVVTRVTR